MTDRAPELTGNPEPHRGMYRIRSVADMQAVAEEMGIPIRTLAEQGAHFADMRLAPTQRVPLGAAIVAVGTGTEDLTEFWGRVNTRISQVDAAEHEGASRELRRMEARTTAAEMAEQPPGRYPIGESGAVFRAPRLSDEAKDRIRATLEREYARRPITEDSPDEID